MQIPLYIPVCMKHEYEESTQLQSRRPVATVDIGLVV